MKKTIKDYAELSAQAELKGHPVLFFAHSGNFVLKLFSIRSGSHRDSINSRQNICSRDNFASVNFAQKSFNYCADGASLGRHLQPSDSHPQQNFV